ncbi:MAG: diacylglycerol kinase family lipid kinase [Deltaproteobacteria bacterium]|nr:diacylglycerol kinase family lipid kinase [Candidatus Anaeroferrophillus wilburensis]MBN2889993.1 diacylglycerol kinase family lipid kinase [Deltaproteobacteria bacterium]
MQTKNNSQSIMFIINPIAGRGRWEEVQQQINVMLGGGNKELFFHVSRYAGHAEELSRALVVEQPEMIVAVGGDGTVNEVVNGIGCSGIPLGVIPRGSGNGFARHLGIPTRLDRALAIIRTGTATPVDMIKINNRYMVNVSGVGFDAQIAWKFHHGQQRGLASYIKITAAEFFTYRPQSYTLTIDGKKRQELAMLISIANSSQFGNNILIAPRASVRDGLLDLCILHPFPLSAVPGLFFWLLRKKIDQCGYLETIKAKKVTISGHGDRYHLDGEAVESNGLLKAEVVEKSLQVIISPHRQEQL